MRTSTFYNTRLDQQSPEEKFLLKQRMRLINKINKLRDHPDPGCFSVSLQMKRCCKKLVENEKKLGIK